MKTLDAEAPSGYFEALPEQLLAKLSTGGEVNMQQTGTPDREASSSATTNAPPVPREEDSGLHDIRNLAQSTKQRLSKRTTGSQALIKQDDDVLASSSASWKNLALPQPAAMVSLPELDELPSKQEIAKQAKAAAKEAARAAKQQAKHEAVTPSGVYDSATGLSRTSDANMSDAVEFKPAFSAFAAPKAKKAGASHKGRNIALVGMGLAAAAGVTLFVMTQKNNDAQPRVAQSEAVAPAAAPAGNGISADKMKQIDEANAKLAADHQAQLAAEAAAAAAPAAGEGSATTGAVAPEPPAETAVMTKAPVTKPSPKHAVSKAGKGKVETTTAAPVAEQKADARPGKTAGGGDTAEKDKDFDALLKEAGVADKKAVKPKLDKKELSGEDFKKGMSAIAAKAAACYKGTQGSANVKLVIAPSGSVSKVTVSGAFAGKPEAACVSAAVKGASFPAWDGPPQSFGYPILLSE
ncbi:MAG: hypothetical protein ABJE66_27680 [Deltaproteobacteria bacterium]